MEDIKLKDLIYIVRNALTTDQCNSLIKEYEDRNAESVQESCLHAVTDVMTTSTFKRIELIPETENFNIVHTTTNKIIKDWINYLEKFKSFHTNGLKRSLRYSHMHRLMKYEKDSWIHPHIDWDELIHASCTISLSSDYEGGEFTFWNGKYSIKLNQGDAMIWPADPFWVHEVTPIISGVRYSTNTFIQSLPLPQSSQVSQEVWNLGYNNNIVNDYFYTQCVEDKNEKIY
jgi:predicted 2-oxoglutarate/Fe(II)-dependent dioxygenase YbiX